MPTISLVPLANSLFVSSETIHFNVNTKDEDGAVAKVSYFIDGIRVADKAPEDFSFDWVATAGIHEVKAVAYENNRGDSTVSAPITVKVEERGNVKPSIKITSPPYGRAYFYPESVAFEVDAQDTDGAVTRVEYYAGDSLIQVRYAPSSFNWTWVDPAIKGYNIYVVAYDNNGDHSVSEDIWIYVNQKPNPTATIVSPINNATFQAPATITIDVDATELDGGTQLVEYYANDRYIGQVSDTSFKFVWRNVSEGTYVLKAYAYDSKGVVTYSPSATIVVKASQTQTGDIF